MRLLFCVLITVFQVGCASMRSTPVTRQDDDSYCMQCPANGVPVVISVPTHLKVSVYEQLFFRIEDDNRIVLINKDCHRNLKVASEQMNTEKVIIVDVKRPAAGTLDYNLEFDSKGQSITQYESFVFDRTLEDSANLLAQLMPTDAQGNPTVGVNPENQPDFEKITDFAEEPTAGNPKLRKQEFKFAQSSPTSTVQYEANVFTKRRIVAFRIFDINAVDFEEQVQSFLAHHLNSCHDCSTNPGGPPDGNPQSHSANGAEPCSPVESGSASAEATPMKSNTGNSELLAPLEDSAAGAGSRE